MSATGRPRSCAPASRADRDYLEQLAAAWRDDSPSPRSLANARRRAGLAHNDTDESLQRLLAESWPRRLPFAHFATAFVTYLRRFAQSVTTLTTLHGESDWKQSVAVQSRLALLRQRLQWLEAQFEIPECRPTTRLGPSRMPTPSRRLFPPENIPVNGNSSAWIGKLKYCAASSSHSRRVAGCSGSNA